MEGPLLDFLHVFRGLTIFYPGLQPPVSTITLDRNLHVCSYKPMGRRSPAKINRARLSSYLDCSAIPSASHTASPL